MSIFMILWIMFAYTPLDCVRGREQQGTSVSTNVGGRGRGLAAPPQGVASILRSRR